MLTRKLLSTIAKLGVSAALIAYLVIRARQDEQFGSLLAGQKNWPVLLCALPVCLFAVTITILRWRLLIGALGLSFSVRETLRAGFLGYLANLLPFGLVAGDSLKAVMLIHRNPRRKTEAVASVIVDRVLGLFALLLLAAVGAFCVAVTNNFFLNRHWTFQATGGHAGFQAARFFTVSVFALGVNLVLLYVLVDVASAPEVPSQAISVAAAMPLNFVGNKLWTFGRNED